MEELQASSVAKAPAEGLSTPQAEQKQSGWTFLLPSLAIGAVLQAGVYGASSLDDVGALGLSLFLLLFVLTVAVFLGRKLWEKDRLVVMGFVPLLTAAAGFALHDSTGLDAANFALASLGLVLLASWVIQDRWSWTGMIISAARFCACWASALGSIGNMRWSFARRFGFIAKLWGAVLGATLSLPVLLVMGALLASADPSFAKVFQWTLPGEEIAMRALLALGIGWGFFSLLDLAFQNVGGNWDGGRSAQPRPQNESDIQLDLSSTLVTFLGLLCGLFALFLAIQARALFGGDSYVLATEGVTYAAYARRGFFEIAGVVAVGIPLLIMGEAVAASQPGPRKAAAIMSGLTALLMILMLASAFHRMSLYVGVFGLTSLRYWATAGMVLMLLVLAGAVVMGFRFRLSRMAGWVAATASLVGVAVNILPPDRVITRLNLRHARSLAPHQLKDLRADAYPVLKASRPDLAARWLAEWKKRQDGRGMPWPSVSQMRVLREPLPALAKAQ